MTAGDVIARVRANLGAPWRENTYRDTFKFGGPDTRVTGIATTAFVSLEVIEKAAAARLNMIIPHEVTYWNDRDEVSALLGDAVYQRKVLLLQKHDMAVFRLHDHMHVQRPDFTFVGSARDIGLDPKHETAPGSHLFVVPETTLGTFAAAIAAKSGARALRVVGDPAARVSRVRLGVGYGTPPIHAADVDVVVSGEQQEADSAFDSAAYVLDATACGVVKGWIMLGHTISEEAGMLEMAQWIAKIVPEVPVQLVEAGEPFWAP
jgi:putative NIF3 family GTP cyclohydrolase 1 type 2